MLSGTLFHKAAIEAAAENELSAVILFMQHVSLPECVYFKAFKVLQTKGDFPSCCSIVQKYGLVVVCCCRILTLLSLDRPSHDHLLCIS